MAITEVFANPTVKVVLFQVRFPNLFYLESKIGDLQVKIMSEFPESKLQFRRKFLMADLGPDANLEEILSKTEPDISQKIWTFESPTNVTLNVLSDSLDISSKTHKSYSNPAAPARFRDLIESVTGHFVEVTKIPLFTRVGLRYIDECPIPGKTNQDLLGLYRSSLPLARFNASDADEMQVVASVSKGRYKLRYQEALREIEGERKLILDFDCFALDIKADELMTVTDELHTVSSDEYELTITEALKQRMRGKE